MIHWWNRSKREQKQLRRWARRKLERNLRRRADLVIAADRRRQEQRREQRATCARCGGRGQVLARRRGERDWQTVPCPACRSDDPYHDASKEDA